MTGKSNMVKNGKVAAVYARTSVEDPNSKKVSIDQQAEDGKALAESNGYEVTAASVYVDRDLSGKLPPTCWADHGEKSRPEFSRLIKDIEAGKVQAVVFRMRDRIARNTVVSLRFLECCQKHNIAIFATDETIVAGDDPSGRFALTVLIASAQLQVEQTQANIKRAMGYIIRNGMKKCETRLLGYRDGARKEVVVVPEAAVVVKAIFDRYVSGESLGSICRWLNADHADLQPKGKAFEVYMLCRMIRNVHYIGKTAGEGAELIDSKVFEPIIDSAVFMQAQNLMKTKRNNFAVKTETHLLSGFLACGCCGQKLVANGLYEAGNRNGFVYKSRCKCEGKAFQMSEGNWLLWADKFLSVNTQVAPPLVSGETVTLQLQLDRLDSKLADLQAEYSNPKKDMKISEYQAMSKGIAQNRLAIESKIRELQATTEVAADLAWTKWENLSADEKRLNMKLVIETIRVYSDRVEVINKRGMPMVFDLHRVHTGKRPMNVLTSESGEYRTAIETVNGQQVRTFKWATDADVQAVA